MSLTILKDIQFEILEKIISLEDSFYNNLDLAIMHQTPELKKFTSDFQESINFIYKKLEVLEEIIGQKNDNDNVNDNHNVNEKGNENNNDNKNKISISTSNINYDQLHQLNQLNKK